MFKMKLLTAKLLAPFLPLAFFRAIFTGLLKTHLKETSKIFGFFYYYFAQIIPICCIKKYIVLYFLPVSAFSSRNNLCKNLVAVGCFLLFKAKYKRNGL